jgi:hypothetical protein
MRGLRWPILRPTAIEILRTMSGDLAAEGWKAKATKEQQNYLETGQPQGQSQSERPRFDNRSHLYMGSIRSGQISGVHLI